MNDSESPSLSKSASALPPTLVNGITAMESICGVVDLPRQYHIAAPAAMSRTTTMGTKYLQSFPRPAAAFSATLTALGDEDEASAGEEPDAGTDTETDADDDTGTDD